MTKLHYCGTIALTAVFSATLFFYSFYQPFILGAVCEAIPAVSTFVYRADSLEELLQSPLCGQLDKALGAGNTLRNVLESSDWTKLAAPSEIAVADIPLRQAGQSKTWAASSWVGWRSPWLRWKLEHSRNKNLRLVGKHAVWPVWEYASQDIARGMSLTFSLTDNLLLICLSEKPTDIAILLDTYDKHMPAINPKQGQQP